MRKYTKEVLEEAIKDCNSFRDLARKLVPNTTSGSLNVMLGKRVKEYGIDISHFDSKKWRRTQSNTKKHWREVLCITEATKKADIVRRALIESGVDYLCSKCGMGDTWNEEPITLQVDHINGVRTDNRKENLRFLCPNCHSQTETFGVKNNKSIKKKENFCSVCNKQIRLDAKTCFSHKNSV